MHMSTIESMRLHGKFTLSSIYPDVKDLTEISEEELGRTLLTLARHYLNSSSLFIPANIATQNGLPSEAQEPLPEDAPKYKDADKEAVILALSEAWNWLRLGGFIMPAPGLNAGAGWMMLTKKGVNESEADIRAKHKAESIPRPPLRPVGAPPVAAPSGPPKAGK